MILYPPATLKITVPLQIDQVRVQRVLPPVVGYSAGPPGNFRQVFQPPFMEKAHVSIPPFVSIDLADVVSKGREIVPIVTIAEDLAWIVIVVILVAVGSKMNISDLGFPRGYFVVKCELGVKVGISLRFSKCLDQDGLAPMTE